MPSKQLPYRLTGDHFYKFFQCPHWIWYDLYADQSRRAPMSPILDMIYRDGLKHERTLAGAGRAFEEIKPELYRDLDEAFLATLELMKQGKNIYHGVLMDQHWVGSPDLLEARPVETGMRSTFGNHYYVTYDIKNTDSMRDDYKFQLVFYSLILERLQGVLPPEAYLINSRGESRSFRVEDFLESFHLTRERIERILDGEKPPPFLKSGCRHSPWFSICLDDAKSCDDVSLIYRLSQNDQKRLYEAGVRTIHDLAAADLDDLSARFADWSFDKLLRFQSQAAVLISGQPVILKKTRFPETAVELYFDVESDPTENIDYLCGVLVCRGNKTEYRSAWANDKADEGNMWERFLKILDEYPAAAIYHYSAYEREVFKRLSNQYGISAELDARFRDSTIDLQQAVTEAAILPLYFYGLKDIAQYLGFQWRAPDAGGAESVVWYNDWLSNKNPAIKRKITEYNEDDVRATLYVKEWLERVQPRQVKEVL